MTLVGERRFAGLVGVPLVALALELLIAGSWGDVRSEPGLIAVLLVSYTALGPAALVMRERYSFPVFAVIGVQVTLAALWLPIRPLVSLFFALFSVARRERVRDVTVAVVATLVVLVAYVNRVISLLRPGTDIAGALLVNVLFWSCVTGATVIVGGRVGRGERQITDLEERQAQAAREAVIAERRRLARELHDIVSHAVTIMVLQSAGARESLRATFESTEPPPVAADVMNALLHIEQKGQEAMAELRRLVTVMRAANQLPDEEDSARGLTDLRDLCATFVATGQLAISFDESGSPRRLDRSIDLTAYRVVKEALTNSAKHAGAGAAVTIDLRWEDELVVDVRDTRAPGAAVGSGFSTGTGLVGMKERVHAVGGTLDVGPRNDGLGYRVHAALPLSQATSR